ncbi:MAG: flagellar basal body protein, partial [Nitrospinota bacterium]
MAGLTGVLNIGKSSLETSQTALNVIAKNIANSAVEGYSRQEAIITTNTTGDG